MFRLVLISLDGSRLAEAVLPAAAAVARAFRARVTLLHVIEADAPTRVHGEPHLRDVGEAEAYLLGVAQRPVFAGQAVEVHVHVEETADVAGALMDHAGELGAGLVAMATHGWRGLREVLFGSMALQTLQRGTTPILLVRPAPDGGAPPFACRRILVPLDGTPGHEPALLVAATLARTWGASMRLETVVPTRRTLSGAEAATGVLLPTAAQHVLDLAAVDAERYVERLAAGLTADAIPATGHVSRGDPGACLVQAADTAAADLVVLASHAKGALEAFWAGSLTPKVLAALHRPIFLVRGADEGHLPPAEPAAKSRQE
jgi:nucleotide-binding universal stress UspA family protein